MVELSRLLVEWGSLAGPAGRLWGGGAGSTLVGWN